MYPHLPKKTRETAILQKCLAVFIIGIGWTLADGYLHEMRAADYDDWVTETVSPDGRLMHGLNGDILVWNPVTKRRHALSSMGIRVTKETLVQQLELTDQMDFLKLPHHQAVLNDEIPLSIHRPVEDHHAAPQEGPPRRVERDRLAQGAQGDVPAEEHLRAGVERL